MNPETTREDLERAVLVVAVLCSLSGASVGALLVLLVWWLS